MVFISVGLFVIFIIFQLLYIFIPLYVVKNKNAKFRMLPTEKGISILIPAYNEEKTILNCVEGILNLQYKNFEAIIINDGSTDLMFSMLYEQLELQRISKNPDHALPYNRIRGFYQSKIYPNIYVLNKVNGGKADALNAGTDYANHEIVITLDADSILEPKSLSAMNSAFEDREVVAAGGLVQISQGFRGSSQKPLPIFTQPNIVRYQIVQYLTDFYLHKTTQAQLGAITVIAGAFGAFRKWALIEVNGYRKTVGEDLDITLRMHQLIKESYSGGKLIFVPKAVCYTECPSDFRSLMNQRIRWQKGFIDCLVNFRKGFFTRMGTSVSTYLLVDSLILGTMNAYPTILIPVLLMFTQNIEMALTFLALTFLLAMYRSLAAFEIAKRYGHQYSKKDFIRLCWFVPFEIITYRLLGLVFVTVGTILYFKNKEGWNSVKRSGVNNQSFGDGIQLNRKKVG